MDATARWQYVRDKYDRLDGGKYSGKGNDVGPQQRAYATLRDAYSGSF